MMDRRHHIDPWAEKLSQVSLPDSGEAWTAMEALLDKEMPVDKRGGRRKWVLLLLLLLLLIGVCNCPGGGRFWGGGAHRGDSARFGNSERFADSARLTGGERSGDGGEIGGGVSNGKPGGGISHGKPGGLQGSSEEAVTPGDEPPRGGPRANAGDEKADHDGVAVGSLGTTALHRHRHKFMGGGSRELARSKPTRKDRRTGARGNKKDIVDNSIIADTAWVDSAGDPSGQSVKDSGLAKQPDTASPNKKDSVRKSGLPGKKDLAKTQAAKKSDSTQQKKREHGWVVGVGLNQFFTVGGQQASNYNSGGITGTLSDYIPVPMVRFYVNKRLYLQMEAQFNTPQYTKGNLIINYVKPDTSQPVQLSQTAAIKKLFYFNVPLSVHYNVYDNLDLGAGLQYSRLSNAIGTFDDTSRLSTSSTGNSQTAQTTKSFKDDTLYNRIKTAEFRFLLDASYTWKGFVLGVRYNQALSKFINIKVQNGQVTQSRNSSLQLYLRYILWDTRRKNATNSTYKKP